MNLEKDLIVRLINADEAAFRQIFDYYFKTVRNFVNNHIKEAAQAEDITQNIFIRLWENKSRIDINKSFDGYIFTIAYRMVVDHYRQARTAISSRSGEKLHEAIPSTSYSDELLNLHQLESMYMKALQTLPLKRKEIFLLSRHKGLSNKEIAERLNISVKTVENQMTSALSGLRNIFAKSDFDSLIFLFFYFQLA
jgi:RNA polymerase sigma-70 factor (ECF subfamily)